MVGWRSLVREDGRKQNVCVKDVRKIEVGGETKKKRICVSVQFFFFPCFARVIFSYSFAFLFLVWAIKVTLLRFRKSRPRLLNLCLSLSLKKKKGKFS